MHRAVAQSWSGVQPAVARLGAVLVILIYCGIDARAAEPRAIHAGLTGEQFAAEFDRQRKREYRLIDVSTCIVNAVPQMAGIWEQGAPNPWKAGAGYTPEQFQAKRAEFSEDGFQLVHLSSAGFRDKVTYDGIWEKADRPAPEVRLELSAPGLEKSHADLDAQGYRLARIAVAERTAGTQFAGLWVKEFGDAQELQLRLSAAGFQREFDRRTARDQRLHQVVAYSERRRLWYACVWQPGDGSRQDVTLGLTADELADVAPKKMMDGFQPLQVTAYAFGGRDRYSVVWEKPSESETGEP